MTIRELGEGTIELGLVVQVDLGELDAVGLQQRAGLVAMAARDRREEHDALGEIGGGCCCC